MSQAGVACNVHYKPLPMHTAYKQMGFDIQDYPNSYALFENEVTLPLNSKMTVEDVCYVAEHVKEAFAKPMRILKKFGCAAGANARILLFWSITQRFAKKCFGSF